MSAVAEEPAKSAAAGNDGGFAPSGGQARPFHDRNPSPAQQAQEFAAGILDPEEGDEDDTALHVPEAGGEG